MWKRILQFRNALAALGLWLSIFALPLKVEQFPPTLKWWVSHVMPDRQTLWMLLSAALVIWIFWIDARPAVFAWIGIRKGPPNMHLAAFVKLFKDKNGSYNFASGENIRQMKQKEESGTFFVEFQRPTHSPSMVVKQDGRALKIIEKTDLRVEFEPVAMDAMVDTMFEFECEYNNKV